MGSVECMKVPPTPSNALRHPDHVPPAVSTYSSDTLIVFFQRYQTLWDKILAFWWKKVLEEGQ